MQNTINDTVKKIDAQLCKCYIAKNDEFCYNGSPIVYRKVHRKLHD